MAKTEEVKAIVLQELKPRTMRVKIVGDSDLVLNKMNDCVSRKLIDARKDRAKSLEKSNEWEEIVTSIHWRDGKPADFSEAGMKKALQENAPCITQFGLKKSFGESVIRNNIDKFKTKFDANVNINSKGGLIPITFTEWNLDEKLMSPQKGAPVLVRLNRFCGWSAEFEISFMENVFSAEQILNIISLAGFGLGIGSGRSSGFGRYHIEAIN